MIRKLKDGRDPTAAAVDHSKVKTTVETILADVQARGDAAVRELSERFDRWSPSAFRLTRGDIDACIEQVSKPDLDDIRFAQDQIRRFAEIQKTTLRDVEVETLPGVILGHKHIPMSSAGCY